MQARIQQGPNPALANECPNPCTGPWQGNWKADKGPVIHAPENVISCSYEFPTHESVGEQPAIQ